jgi:tetratricopeptide (TPR) repeat protein
MKICDGTPAKRNGLQYMEGTLPALEADHLEEHFFSCPACLQVMQTLQIVAEEFVHMPAVLVPAKRWSLLAWPRPVWSMGAVAALLLIGFFVHKNFESRRSQSSVSRNQTTQPIHATAPARSEAAPPLTHATSTPVRLSQLADLTLPVYLVPALRGEKLDAHFVAGMKEYAKGNCGGAVQALAQLSAEDAEARTAAFYEGACQMHLGNYASAATLLHKIADADNAPRQEAALYLLAQVSLAEDDPAAAHAYLERTISLNGDLQERAQAENLRIIAMHKKSSGLLQQKLDSK